MTKQTSRYTEEELEFIKKEYVKRGNEGLIEIAGSIGKSVNSVRAKLVREKIYKPSPETKRIKKNGPSKKEILRELQEAGLEPDGLENATKGALLNIKKFIEQKIA